MDENTNTNKLLQDLKFLNAENESLKAKVEEYKLVDFSNKNTILQLKQMVADFQNVQNKLNAAIIELGLAKNINEDIKTRILAANKNEMYLQKELYQSGNFKHKLAEVENDCINKQMQLQDAVNKLNEVSINRLSFNEQKSRIALLECLLADAKQEIDDLKLVVNEKF